MKKLMFGIAGVIAMVTSANAVDTAQIKAACQASDKTLWVERNQVCIPRNPCKDSKFEKYCNRDFKDVETYGNVYMGLIELYADTHNLSCVPVEQESKLFGQDYVICMGKDVMVFEFDDIRDRNLSRGGGNRAFIMLAKAFCSTVSGNYNDKDYYAACDGINETMCSKIDKIVRKSQKEFVRDDNYFYMWSGGWDGKACVFGSNADNRGKHLTTLGELDPNYEGGH